MNNGNRLQKLFLILLIVIIISGISKIKLYSQEAKKPNIILLFADDISTKEFPTYNIPDPTYEDASCETPVLDKMAKEGVQFKNFWANPLCHPSRGQMMTGRFAYKTGWWSNEFSPGEGHPCEVVYDCNIVFSHLMKDAGYKTQMVGKWQIGGDYVGWAFDEYVFTPGKLAAVTYDPASGHDKKAYYWNSGFTLLNHPDYPESFGSKGLGFGTTWDDFAPDIELRYVKNFIDRKNKNKEEFMVYWPSHLGHKNWVYDMSRKDYAEVPIRDENGEWTGKRSSIGVNNHVEYLDYLLGEIIDYCDSLGIMDNTIILFSTDNGTTEYGKGKKGLIRERGPKVPLVVYGPGFVNPMGEVDELGNVADVLPTLAELSGATVPDDYHFDGKSMVPFFTGQTKHHREWIYSYDAQYQMVRTRDVVRDGIGRFWDTRGKASQEDYKQIKKDPDSDLIDDIGLINHVLDQIPTPNMNDGSDMVEAYIKEKGSGIKTWEDITMKDDLDDYPVYDLSKYKMDNPPDIISTTTYTLNVSKGSGDGSYDNGTVVNIIADTPAKGQQFDKWTGDIDHISDINDANATVTITAKAMNITANFRSVDAVTYTLNVVDGSGKGNYEENEVINISGNLNFPGYDFTQWMGDIENVTDVNSENTTITMPAKNISISAIYLIPERQVYNLTVNTGTGSGKYFDGQLIYVSADKAPIGYQFYHWIGDVNYIGNALDSSTTINMPAQDIDITAVYKINPPKPTAIDENSLNKIGFTCYPNPTNSDFTIDLSIIGNATIDIYNKIGLLVYHAESNKSAHNINDHNLSSGMYFIRVTDCSNGSCVQKLIVN